MVSSCAGITRAENETSRSCMEKATRLGSSACSWLKATSSTFTNKNLINKTLHPVLNELKSQVSKQKNWDAGTKIRRDRWVSKNRLLKLVS